MTTKPISIKGAGCKFGGCARKAVELPLGNKLKVNQQKSAAARPWERKFLGFSFTSASVAKRRIAPKAVGRFKSGFVN